MTRSSNSLHVLTSPSTTYRALEILPNSPKSLLHNQNHSFHPPHSSFLVSLLHRCGTLRHLKQIHAQMILSDLISFPFAAGRLVSFCAISDTPDLPYSVAILRSLFNPNAFAWNVAIRGYSDSDDPKKSIFLYRDMLRGSARPNNRTFPFLFKACAKMSGWCRSGYAVFGHVMQLGLLTDVFVFNAGIHMFAVCGGPEDARKLFDESCVKDVVSWNSLINAYVQCGKPQEGLRLFREMEVTGIRPDEVTMIGLVSCCTQLQDLDLGRKFHRYAEENGLEFTVPLTNALMDMYVKSGSLEPAQFLFDGMKKRTVISCTTMIVGYAKFGLLDAARSVFDKMPEKDVVLGMHC
ncbi:hypothetical protein J5N97_010493 [Dioscorea zingiberensis]|uniref:Pentatricopeptide repeat-containing protein n=1 Tax=Dioscorea zingiberensis TaxID=325984 RepID=A0A9D5D1A3_9LILI|nr:hypothetical protein J5N97_010493 [Dioscorea zingiberensis]